MLLALLLPDPCDPNCPEEFKTKARAILAPLPQPLEPDDEGLRRSLLRFIGDFANWDLATNSTYLEAGRALVKAANPEETPLVVDPFAGGGSIPLEALRLGCDAFASDLNPVACLILKVMLEDIPRHGPELAEELSRVGVEIKKQAEKELAEFYPKDPDGSTPIAYLWARTVQCESPNCGAEIPLMRTFWLCKKANRRWALRHQVVRHDNKTPSVVFEIYEPSSEKDVRNGTVTRAKATCLCCGAVLPPERVRAQLTAQRGGADVVFDTKGNRTGGARMLAVVTLHSGIQGRHYRLPVDSDYQAVLKAQRRMQEIINEWESGDKKGLCPVPDEPLPEERRKGSSGFRVLLYGMKLFGDLFTIRQKLSILSLLRFIKEVRTTDEIKRILSLGLGKVTMQNSSSCRWKPTGESLMDTFGRQALPIVFDFAESIPISGTTGDFSVVLDWISELIRGISIKNGTIQQADAVKHPLPDQAADIWFTDPPYYDSIAYADLSDFFFVWYRRSSLFQKQFNDYDETSNKLTPKRAEAIQDPRRKANGGYKDAKFYENIMALSFAEGRRLLKDEGLGTVVFAHKTTEGWEALLTGLIRGNWTITSSWPIATEMSSRLIARDTAALATSVHLVCRPRPNNAPVGDWSDVLRELPNRVGDWMERLQGEGIRGADLVFACIGPALEIFSRYTKVETAEGREVKLAEYLEKVWEVVGRMALEQVLGTEEARARNGMAGVLEEDARLTALFLWTLQSTNGGNGDTSEPDEDTDNAGDDDEGNTPAGSKAKGFSLVFDVVRRFAQPLGIDLPKWENRIIKTEKGVVRLLPVSERAKQLFGEESTETVADWIQEDPMKNLQLKLFPEMEEAPRIRGRGRRRIAVDASAVEGDAMQSATTLDRVHAAMLLQAGGQANALRMLIKAEQERGSDFIRLANALSALYPRTSEEKRLLDAMLLAVPR
jgi:adenine-specific DNA methylase